MLLVPRALPLLVLAVGASSSLTAQDPDVAARRLADVATLAVDEYRLGVSAGRVVSPGEVAEARQFLADARGLANQLPPALATRVRVLVDSLAAGVEATRDAQTLDPYVARLRAELATGLGISLDRMPETPPSLARGRELFQTNCASCHGARGTGDGALAPGLHPPPADLTADELSAVSPLEFYRKINVGVSGTSMPPFGERLSENDRWAVALYAASLRFTDAERSRGRDLLHQRCPACLERVSGFEETASLSDDSLAALARGSLSQPGDSAVRDMVAYARTAGAVEELGGDLNLRAVRIVGAVKQRVAAAVADVRAGNRAGAMQGVLDAYLVFERIESRLRARRPRAASEAERAFADLRLAIAGTQTAPVEEAGERLDRVLDLASDELTAGSSAAVLFAQSLVIILREGFEAILVIGALVAFLVRADSADRKREIGIGVSWAVLASLLTAVGYATVFRHAQASQEALEGLTMLVAAVVLFWVSYWLVSKIEVRKWQAFVAAKVNQALTSRRALALAAVAFLAVYREGFETVLFYAALFASAGGAATATVAITAGLALGGAALCIVYYIMQRYGARLPLKPFFAVTSALLYAMAFSFAGQGVAELQAAGYVRTTPLPGIPTVPALGIFPTLQSFLLQAVLAAALGVALIWIFWLEPRAARAA